MKITSLDLPHYEDTEESLATSLTPELPESVEVIDVMQGLKYWHNPINQFCVVMLHRSADPKKRSPAWINKTRAGLSSSDWLREYELHWEALDGRPVYVDDYSAEFHVSKSSLGWNPKLVVCRGWDFGLYPACLFAQLFPYSRLIVLREMIGEDISTERFTYEVNRLSAQWFPGATFYEFIDPTGRNRAGTDGRSYARILAGKPLLAKRIIPGTNSKVGRHSAVTSFLKENVKGLPCLYIDPSCEMLIKGFGGGYMYAFNKGTLKPDPEKNIFSHIHDALQYLASKVRSTPLKLHEQIKSVTEPRYGSGVKPLTINY